MKPFSAAAGLAFALGGVMAAVGCKSEPPTAVIPPDTQAPTIALATPGDAADGVALTTTVQIKLNEAVIVGSGGGIRLTRQGSVVPGNTTVSTDSLTLTFAPSGALAPNAIYRASFASVGDKAGNAIPGATTACFVTTSVGATRSVSFNDPDANIYTGGAPSSALLPPDILAARFARDVSQFSVTLQFTGPRIFSDVANNRAGVWMDFDTDQDSATGLVTLKDTLFGDSPMLQTSSSGTRAEYWIDLEPTSSVINDANDSAEVAKYTVPADTAELGQITYHFVPDACGPYMGFSVPWTALGNDDGNMNAVFLGIVGDANGLIVDPMPANSHLTLALPLLAPPVATTISPAPPVRAVRRARPRRPLFPLR